MTKKVVGDIFRGSAYIKWFRSQEYYNSAQWRGTTKLDGGGVLINQAIHTIDLFQYFMGEADTIFGQTGIYTHSGIEGEDNAAAIIKFKNGAIGTIEASTSINPVQPRRIELFGTKGTLVLDGDKLLVLKTGTHKSDKSSDTVGADNPFQNFSILPHKRQYDRIAKSIINKTEIVVSGEESLISLGIVQAIYKSNDTGKPVKLQNIIGMGSGL